MAVLVVLRGDGPSAMRLAEGLCRLRGVRFPKAEATSAAWAKTYDQSLGIEVHVVDYSGNPNQNPMHSSENEVETRLLQLLQNRNSHSNLRILNVLVMEPHNPTPYVAVKTVGGKVERKPCVGFSMLGSVQSMKADVVLDTHDNLLVRLNKVLEPLHLKLLPRELRSQRHVPFSKDTNEPLPFAFYPNLWAEEPSLLNLVTTILMNEVVYTTEKGRGTQGASLVQKSRYIRLEGREACGVTFKGQAYHPEEFSFLSDLLVAMGQEATAIPDFGYGISYNSVQYSAFPPASLEEIASARDPKNLVQEGYGRHQDDEGYLRHHTEDAEGRPLSTTEIKSSITAFTFNFYSIPEEDGGWEVLIMPADDSPSFRPCLSIPQLHGSGYFQAPGSQSHFFHGSRGPLLSGVRIIVVLRLVVPGFYLCSGGENSTPLLVSDSMFRTTLSASGRVLYPKLVTLAAIASRWCKKFSGSSKMKEEKAIEGESIKPETSLIRQEQPAVQGETSMQQSKFFHPTRTVWRGVEIFWSPAFHLPNLEPGRTDKIVARAREKFSGRGARDKNDDRAEGVVPPPEVAIRQGCTWEHDTHLLPLLTALGNCGVGYCMHCQSPCQAKCGTKYYGPHPGVQPNGTYTSQQVLDMGVIVSSDSNTVFPGNRRDGTAVVWMRCGENVKSGIPVEV